ncbi:unnamed protein product [Cercopithifilaria johnstoni]|uniref:Uncharacterized protein n=1 Tax=Cercopithifilaria johnstoni TaxID=2874296 RepID=A0A8J2MCP9_9BILA|nr:unnamed protein product [Cercopithifilaria johnstoni]
MVVNSINRNDKQQSLHYGLPRISHKYMPNISREVHVMETVPLNPGTLSNFHKDCLTCIENGFTGVRFTLNKFIPSSSIKLNNKIRVGIAQIDSELITKYITTRRTRLGEHSILVEAVTNFIVPWPSISISQALDDFLYMSVACSPQDNIPKADVELEYYGRTGTLAFKYTGWPSYPDTIYSTSYLRSITQKLALGSQLTFRYFALPEPNQKLFDITYYAQYKGSAYTACFDFCKSNGYHFSYFRNIDKYLACAVDIAGSRKIPKYGSVITGHLTSDGAVTCLFKKRFTGDFPISVTLSGSYNFFAGECGFGIGLCA